MSKNKRAITLWVLVAMLGGLGFAAETIKPETAWSAVVQTIAGNPSPKCPSGYVFNQAKGTCDLATASGDADIVVEDSGVGSFNLNMSGTIVADVHLKGTKKHSPRCGVANGWNGYAMVNGHWVYRYEKNVRYCPNPNSPTGFAKVGGGDTGKDCENPFKPGRKAPGPKLAGPITELNSFNVHIPVTAQAHAKVHGQCPNIDVGGEASASGLVKVTINQSMILKAKGKVSSLKVLLREALRAKGVAKATAQLHLKCKVPPTSTVTSTVGTTSTAPGSTVTVPGSTSTTTRTSTTTSTSTSTSTSTTTPSAPTLSVTTINDVDAGGHSRNFCVTWNLPGSDSGTLTVSAVYGSFTPSGSITVSGAGSSCQWTYNAPGEVPPTSGGKDTVTVTLRDNVTGLSAPMNPPSNPQSFAINPPPPSQ